MKVPMTAVLLAGTLLCSGCALVRDGTDLVAYRARQWVDECREQRRNRQWAEDAWEQVQCSLGPRSNVDDYGAGFKDGFCDFLFKGGTGEPPLVAPKRYRGLSYQTASGYQAAQAWLDGYRHGSAVARDGGYRQFVVGPTTAQLVDTETVHAVLGAPTTLPEMVEPLPRPRPMPPPPAQLPPAQSAPTQPPASQLPPGPPSQLQEPAGQQPFTAFPRLPPLPPLPPVPPLPPPPPGPSYLLPPTAVEDQEIPELRLPLPATIPVSEAPAVQTDPPALRPEVPPQN